MHGALLRHLLAILAFVNIAAADAAAASPVLALLDSVVSDHPEFDRVLVESAVELLSEDYLAAARAGGEASWSIATRAYVSDLWRAVDAVAAGAPLRVLRDPDASVRLVLGSAPAVQVSLLPSRADGRARLEQRIAQRVSARLGLSRAMLAPPASDHGSAMTVNRRARPSAPVVNGDGLTCRLPDDRHRRLYERACAMLLSELRGLASRVREIADTGSRISLQQLAAAIAATPQELAGQPLRAPLLARYAEIRAEALRWLVATIAGRRSEVSVAVPTRFVYAQPLASLPPR